jgi:flavin-dependent dehydrogenase
MTPDSPLSGDRYDVVIAGGAFSGAATAMLLRRDCPQLRILIVEKAEAFDAKVGEATTEMSAMFLTRRLAIWQHLEREHLPKEGLRYWFSNAKVLGHATASETGGSVRSTVPSFQLATAVAEGAELLRPARVLNTTIGEFDHRVTVESNGETREISCRWLLDATGRANLVGRKLDLIERNDEHPTAALWCRWKGVKHIDELAVRLGFAGGNVSSRRLGTNHYTGRGYWIWVIPLGNGETSIGIVFDKRLVDLHQSKDRGADYVAFLRAIPSLAELLEGAEPRMDDFRFYSHLAYVSKQYMGKGWALLGDAAAFLDPYYSPGLDHASFTAEATAEIVRRDAMGEEIAPLIAEHNATFVRSYWRFFRASYKDKYYYMGEADLLSASMLIDTAQYYIFVVIPAYRLMKKFHWMPVLGPKPAFISYHLMRTYNLRFKAIAEKRRARGIDGMYNDGRRIRAYFDLGFAPMRMVVRGLLLWARAEWSVLFARKKRAAMPGKKAGAVAG